MERGALRASCVTFTADPFGLTLFIHMNARIMSFPAHCCIFVHFKIVADPFIYTHKAVEPNLCAALHAEVPEGADVIDKQVHQLEFV